MNRRSFIAGILTAGVAPVFLGSKSPAGLFLPEENIEIVSGIPPYWEDYNAFIRATLTQIARAMNRPYDELVRDYANAKGEFESESQRIAAVASHLYPA